MDNSPWFEHDDLFDHRRVRLADIDGSGTADLIYLDRDGARLWFNRSGNAWSPPRELPFPVATTNVGQIQVADLLGNGTACLVWSSDLPGDDAPPAALPRPDGRHEAASARRAAQQPRGGDRRSTTPRPRPFYLRDKATGTPWVTRLPFPVHCVEQVTVTDLHRKSVFTTTYSYHHGYFDGVEREFRGFGRVEQVDTQRFDDFSAANRAPAPSSPPITRSTSRPSRRSPGSTPASPPIARASWGCTRRSTSPPAIDGRLPVAGFAERELSEPEIDAAVPDLDADEWREAMRACKGMTLRQEIVRARRRRPCGTTASTGPSGCSPRPTTTAGSGGSQPRGPNQHAVFLVTESEAVTYHYELDLSGTGALSPDPRVAHTLNLRFDDYGRALQSVAAVYPRQRPSTPTPR